MASAANTEPIINETDQPTEAVVVTPTPKVRWYKRLGHSYWRKKWWAIPLTVVLILGAVLAVPITRYKLLGLVVKSPITVVVRDSKTNTPVSGAKLVVAGQTVTTDATGQAKLSVKLGDQQLVVSKQYYQTATQAVRVTFSKTRNSWVVNLVATGRQVPVTVINKITGKGVMGADIAVLDTKAVTDTNGTATIVLPTTKAAQTATISGAGYNQVTVSLQVTAGQVPANTVALTPAGQVYFLSNQSGKIDVVKTNLDGSNRQTVLAGTGNEDRYNTVLMASRDWKYLALVAHRSGAQASVYIIDTTNNDKLTTVDEGNATFNLIGWNGSSIVYQVLRNGYSDWQPNQQALKSYNAATSKLYTLDQTAATGTNSYDWSHQVFGQIYNLAGSVVYVKNRAYAIYTNHANDPGAEVASVQPDGTGKKTINAFTPSSTDTTYVYVNSTVVAPASLYLAYYDGSTSSFYDYTDGTFKADPSLTSDKFYAQPNTTYLTSPSGNQTFWMEQRDGKNVLFIGDKAAQNAKSIASLSDYTPYGWYTDQYVLVAKKGSEIYIMAADGSTQPLKVSDYLSTGYNGM